MRSSSRIIGADLARRARPLAEVRSTRVVTPSVSVGRLPYRDLGSGTPLFYGSNKTPLTAYRTLEEAKILRSGGLRI